ncbi:MAG: hypothetical protein M9920_10600 [Verrucomicrobiae bacterium]|nr:hypothetical protein [Verrucomicrobiae bacterium]
MNINPETDLDLEKLFLPAWAQQDANTANRYAKYTGEEGAARSERGEHRGSRSRRTDGGFDRNKRRPDGFRKPRHDDQSSPRSRPGEAGARGQGARRDFPRGERREARYAPRRPELPPLPEITAAIVPDERGVESMARQVKMTGRAFPLFDIAFLIIQKPERYSVKFTVRKDPQGKVIQPLFRCGLDETVWLTEAEAVAHVLQKQFATFYQVDKVAAEAPKGVYTFVAQCGLSGVILGPPNYHDYQTKLRKLHAERFARMPFEAFKSRVKIVRDEAVVKQWVEEQSWKTEYTCLNVPEPLKLMTREAVEEHFVATHKEAIIKPTESHLVGGVAARSLHGGLGRLVGNLLAEQRRFPMQIATALSQAFAQQGLQFFKVNKTVTHVAVARPHYLDLENTPVSVGVKRIVEFINANPKTTRRTLVEALAPTPAAPTVIPVAPSGEATATTPPVGEPAKPEPTPEQTALISDLHWLIHQGHVLEFADGRLETAKKPVPKPPKPAAVSPPAPAEAAPSVEAATAPAAAPAVVSAPSESGAVARADLADGTSQTNPPAVNLPAANLTSPTSETSAPPVDLPPPGLG